MEQLDISSVHPRAPQAFTAAALMEAPIDVMAAVQRMAGLWNETVEPQWQTVEGHAVVGTPGEGHILHCEMQGVHMLLTPISGQVELQRGQLPPHQFHVMTTFFAPESGVHAGRLAGENPAEESPELRRRRRMVSAHIVFTQLMDALMREPGAIGVYRDELGVVMPPDMVTTMSDMLTTGDAPLPLWVNVRTQHPDLTYGRTLGLPSFGHCDLEIRESLHSEQEVYSLLMNTASYIVTGETFLLPGQTLSLGDTDPISLTQNTSPADGQPVIVMDY